jgi:pimeloyl-ACP methyl ester carboxylesterase
MEIQANGLRFHVTDEGSGGAVILLHGFPDTSQLWRHQVDALVKAGFRAIAPDMRGRGQSEKPKEVAAYALPLIASDVVAILDALGIQRAHVVGHDWGAAVAWLVASLYPQRVDRLVAISVGHPTTSPRPTLASLQKGWYRILIQFEGVAEELFQKDDWYLMRELLQGGGEFDVYRKTLSEPGALTAGFNWYRANLPVDRLLAAPPSLPPVSAPTLGIYGGNDLYVTEDRMLASARAVKGPWRYERFADAGHWVPLEQPEKLNRLLLEFLTG